MEKLDDIELDLLLEGVYRRYGYDFRQYARASVKRRVKHFLSMSGCEKITELTLRVLHDESFFQALAENFSVPVTEMFRDPDVYLVLRERVLPYLKTYPFVKIWHAGCATGEEVYSLAIVLKEEGMYDRCTIFATDLNEMALQKAKEGIYPLDRLRDYTRNYQLAGGKNSFSEYYHADDQLAVMASSLRKNITFARHNLASDFVFSEMHLVMCRNVLIYFTKPLQERAVGLFSDSLVHDGFLCLGSKESLEFSELRQKFSDFEPKCRIYKKNRQS